MQLTDNIQQNIQIIKDAAAVVYPDNKIMMQLCICQAVLESGVLHGGSVLANKYNNLFGIKGKGIKTHRSVRLPTKEEINDEFHTVQDDFAWNDSVEESFEQHRKIMSLPRYATVWKCTTFIDAAETVRNDGYATDKHYPQELLSVYNELKLGT